ncbi:TRAP transporter substrate-binding protein [Desulfopila sp. IMCC35008]|uniref:TRAP transporter substrate-binding protein n=1 Tax=Desulfopila sp. IMCC35008 TaxID=2653858 RepID=UPI00197A9F57|nr:TRAP transporter substrate-binding protein [Desulfopila sp. IMCC35008]
MNPNQHLSHQNRSMTQYLCKLPVLISLVFCITTSLVAVSSLCAKTIKLRYGHMNAPSSVAGLQAEWLAEAVAKETNGEVEIVVYPSSQLGKLQELAEAVSTGVIALSHNTAGGFGSLYAPFAALDTPYLYKDVNHLMKVTDINSPVMQSLNDGLVNNAGVRVLYCYYFGTRQLTANKEVKSPADLSGVKIRSIPFPIYTSAVEGLGAVAVPVDWSEVPTALATGVVSGQENPVNVVLSNKLYDVQSHMMLTDHIMGGQVIVINEMTWQKLSPEQQDGIAKAAAEVRQKATAAVKNKEETELGELKKLGMKIIGPEEGLDKAAFRANVQKLVNKKFSAEYGELYKQIDAIN